MLILFLAAFALSSHLVLLSTAHGKLEADTTSSQLLVHLAVCVESVVHAASLLLIKNDLQHLAAILLCPHTFANDLDWVDDISQDSIMDRSQSSGSRALLRLVGSAAIGALWAGKNAARGDDDNLAVGELLLEFPSQALLNLVEAWEERDGHEDHDGFLCGNINLRRGISCCCNAATSTS
jgi:hypothetical protein